LENTPDAVVAYHSALQFRGKTYSVPHRFTVTIKLGSALTAARVGFFLEQHRETLFVEDAHLQALRENAPQQPRYWDRKRETGRLVKSWNLIIPERVLN
jgi:hypothetical protein